jgi:pimeloyl-ACP methyl ester carboxylesterase
VLSDAAAGFPPAVREAFAAMTQKVEDGGLGSIAEIAAKRVFSPAYLAAHPEKIEERKKVLLAIDPKAFQAACRILQETDLVPLLHHLKVPTLVVCGQFDQATPPALNKQIVEKVTGAKYIHLRGCGYCQPLERPEQFVAAIKGICRSLITPSGQIADFDLSPHAIAVKRVGAVELFG